MGDIMGEGMYENSDFHSFLTCEPEHAHTGSINGCEDLAGLPDLVNGGEFVLHLPAASIQILRALTEKCICVAHCKSLQESLLSWFYLTVHVALRNTLSFIRSISFTVSPSFPQDPIR